MRQNACLSLTDDSLLMTSLSFVPYSLLRVVESKREKEST
jgi:hypothetical protein